MCCLFAIRLKALKPKPKGYPNEVNTLGDHLRKVRLDRGLLQREVACQIGVNKQNILHWELNRYEPATSFIPRIITFLGYCPFITPTSFGEWMRQCRATVGLSQERLARKLSMDETTLAHWERGEHHPIEKNIKKVQAFFRTNGGDEKRQFS